MNSRLKNTVISTEIIDQLDISGPRYTSYPSADCFVDAYTEDAHIVSLQHRLATSVGLPISIYIHIPFCESLCFFCACNKIVTKNHTHSATYLAYIAKEIALHVKYLGKLQTVSQLHLGGGSPTFFSDDELTQLMLLLKTNFILVSGGEFSIEVDPRTVNADRLAHIASLGFNRISFGVQDFDEAVQLAVHRVQPIEQVFSLVDAAKKLNFDSINVDLIYGLPEQTKTSFAQTLKSIVTLKPDRIALYAYAHLPERFKPQRRISQYALPNAHEKHEMLSESLTVLINARYVYVGMDHFALPDDDLAIAKRQGRLHRNFQGYSTQPDCDLLSFGVSAISRVGANYSQNAKTLEDYYDHLDRGHLPVVRGLALLRDDLIRRAVIMGIMCQGRVDYESIELAYAIDFKSYFLSTEALLAQCQALGLVDLDAHSLQVTPKGWFYVRGIAMAFDRYLQADKNRANYSKII